MGKPSKLKPRIQTIDTSVQAVKPVERIRGREHGRIKKRILLRDGFECQVCGHVAVDLIVDHRVPLAIGGAESDENRQLLCPTCHDVKSAKEAEERSLGGV